MIHLFCIKICKSFANIFIYFNTNISVQIIAIKVRFILLFILRDDFSFVSQIEFLDFLVNFLVKGMGSISLLLNPSFLYLSISRETEIFKAVL